MGAVANQDTVCFLYKDGFWGRPAAIEPGTDKLVPSRPAWPRVAFRRESWPNVCRRGQRGTGPTGRSWTMAAEPANGPLGLLAPLCVFAHAQTRTQPLPTRTASACVRQVRCHRRRSSAGGPAGPGPGGSPTVASSSLSRLVRGRRQAATWSCRLRSRRRAAV